MSSEVVKELIRLKKKLGQGVENCSSCSLVNCSYQSDSASSSRKLTKEKIQATWGSFGLTCISYKNELNLTSHMQRFITKTKILQRCKGVCLVE